MDDAEKKSLEEEYSSYSASLSHYCLMGEQDLTNEDLALAYPIQNNLRHVTVRYSDLEYLTEGGMKKIFTAKDELANTRVALAILKEDSDEDRLEAFFKEAQLTAGLAHPNIPPIFDIGFLHDKAFFAMPILTGSHLDDYVRGLRKKGNLLDNQDKLIDIFLKVCEAVAYAHSKGVIHLDLKPHNIQIDHYARVYLCDWGLAKLMEGDEEECAWDEDLSASITSHGQIKGTLGFMAPEQAEAGQKDQRTDIYALGATLYFLLEGKAPLKGKDVDKLLTRTRQGDLDSLEKTSLNHSLGAIVNKALNLNPDDRYQAVQDMRDDLVKYRQGYATEAEEASFFTLLKLLCKRNSKLVAGIVIFALSVSAVFFYAFLRVREERNLARAQQTLAEQSSLHARQQERIANEKQVEVEDSMRRLQVELQENSDLSSFLAKTYRRHSQGRRLTYEQDVLKVVEDSLLEAKGEERLELLQAKVTLLFVMQRFNQMQEVFEEDALGDSMDWMVALSEKYAKLKPDSKKLGYKGLRELFEEMPYNRQVLEMMCKFYWCYLKPGEYVSYAKLASLILNRLNRIEKDDPHYCEIKLHNNRVDLSGTRWHFFYMPNVRNLLQPLSEKYKHLNLSDSHFYDFKELYKCRFQIVDISGCETRLLEQVDVAKRHGIQRFICRPDDFSQQEVKLLRAHFEIVLRP